MAKKEPGGFDRRGCSGGLQNSWEKKSSDAAHHASKCRQLNERKGVWEGQVKTKKNPG